MAAEGESVRSEVPVNTQPKVSRYHEFLQNYDNGASTLTAEQKCAKLYDEWATYEQDTSTASYNGPSLCAALLSELCPDKNISILDCGAGSGLCGEKLVVHGFSNLTGNDVSQKLLDIAQTKNIYKKLVCCDGGNATKLPFEANEFDALICVGCVSPTAIRPRAIVDWVRVVKPGGVFLILARHRYFQDAQTNEWPTLGFLEEYDKVIQDLEKSKKVELTFKRILPDYVERTEGIAVAYRVL